MGQIRVNLTWSRLYRFPLIPCSRRCHVRTTNAATTDTPTTENVSSLVYISNPLYVDESGTPFETTTSTDSSSSQPDTVDYSAHGGALCVFERRSVAADLGTENFPNRNIFGTDIWRFRYRYGTSTWYRYQTVPYRYPLFGIFVTGWYQAHPYFI
uniref:Uncharacterized protein n=1 Tax=Helianthus annuus TaxID=4232 RepID=A0A251SYA7_HELAN